MDAALFGVSQDDQATQRRFCDAERLPYDLLVDEGGKLAEAFGVPTRGKIDMRWTIVVGRDGKVVTVDSEVGKDIAGHPQRVLADLQKDWQQYLARFKPLFSGRSLDGWMGVHASEDTWTIRDGTLRSSGKPNGYFRTQRAYRDYVLIMECRYPEALGNSGLLLHITGEDKVWPTTLEVQLKHDQLGRFIGMGGAKIEHGPESPLRQVDAVAGEWNRFEVTCKGDTIKVVIDGELVNEGKRAEPRSGYIGLQSEGALIEFRTLAIRSLK